MWALDPDDATEGPMPRGSLLVEIRHEPSGASVNLLRHARRTPEAGHLALRLDPDGTLRLLTRQGGATRADAVSSGLAEPAEPATVTYSWDSGSGRGALSVWRPEAEALAAVPLVGPLPLGPGDAPALLSPAVRAPSVATVALGSEMVAAGPLPGICAQAPVTTPHGRRPICDLAPGDIVTTAEGRAARVRWAGRAVLPATGAHRPVLLRAPHFGLHEDLVVARDQRIGLSGVEVEYLFGVEEVWVRAGDLVDGRSALTAAGLREIAWYQVALDRPGALHVAGLTLAPLAAPAGGTALWATCLAGSVAEDEDEPPDRRSRVLRDYEARSLSRMRAA